MNKYLILVCLLLSCNLVFADETEKQLKEFLQSRAVVDQVYFLNGSDRLDASARQHLDSLVPQLKDLAQQGFLLRVEGFASPEGDKAENVSLSMQRSVAVRDYLRDQHQLNLDLFLTGFGSIDEAEPGQARRVDIATYQQPDAAQALFDDKGTVESIVLK